MRFFRFYALLCGALCAFFIGGAFLWKKRASENVGKVHLSRALEPGLKGNQFPRNGILHVDGRETSAIFAYGIDWSAQAEMQKLLDQYRPDYAAFVAIDARTGRILSLLSHSQDSPDSNFALHARFPAASIFKVITATAAIDSEGLNANSVIAFNGANHTLYKKNVEQVTYNKWTRYMQLKEAFARSVNTVFGKLGVFHIGAANLQLYAERFLFNTDIPSDLPMAKSEAEISSSDRWALAETASGFTQFTHMSPVHGALIASAAANDGIIMAPYLVTAAHDPKGRLLYRANPTQLSQAMSPASAMEIRKLMRATVSEGTSRKSFRSFLRSRDFKEVEVGGKTGSLTGKDPQGKVDWFVGYVLAGDQRIAVAALTVNKERWKVKSSYLAGRFFDHILSEKEPAFIVGPRPASISAPTSKPAVAIGDGTR